jgi:RES domain-containing protein
LGDEWVATAKSLALRVASVIVSSESNILINPHHPRFAEVRSDLPKPIVLDPRLTT